MNGTVDGPILLFDGVCVLCNGFVRFVLAHERAPAIRFATMQSPAGQAILAAHGLPLAGWDSNVFVENGQALQRSASFFAVLRHLRQPWSWLRLGRFLPAVLCDGLYDRVARNRYRLFGRHAACQLPQPDAAARFMA